MATTPTRLVRPSLLPDGDEQDLIWLLPSLRLAELFVRLLAEEAGLEARCFKASNDCEDPEAVAKLRYPLALTNEVFCVIHMVAERHRLNERLNELLEEPERA